MDFLNDVVSVLEEAAGTEYAEYVFKALDAAKPLVPEPFRSALGALIDVERDLEQADEARKAKIKAILDDTQAKAQAIADKW